MYNTRKGFIMETTRIYFFVGTTAELIKLAPVIKELRSRRISFKVITSGQNVVRFDELKKFTGNVSAYYAFRQRPLKIQLPLLLGFMLWCIKALYNYYLFFRHELKDSRKQNTYFVVHGDTVSSLLGASIAKLFSVTLVHIESGLRSFNFFEPFPEEICRHFISRLADIHFCPNIWCVSNLKSIRGEKINTGENTLIETFWYAVKAKSDSPFVKRVKKMKKKYCVLVAHRQEHVIFNKTKTEQMIKFVLHAIPQDVFCVYVVHDLSVPFAEAIRAKTDRKRVLFTKTMPYVDYMNLLSGAEFMVTDGGSNQEEMYYMGKPCLLLRKNTERIEGLHRNVVLSKNKKSVVKRFLAHYHKYSQPTINDFLPPSKIICDYLLH